MDKIEDVNKDLKKSEQNETQFIYDVAIVGYFSTICNRGKPDHQIYKVFVVGSESNEPHFHVWDDATNGKSLHTYVCLTKVEYFHHDGDEDVLSKEQKESLVMFFKSKCTKNKRYKTNWEYALSMWNDNNPDKTQVNEYSTVLDYTQLK